MSEVILNRIGVDHVNFNITTSGDNVATCTLKNLLLDPTLEYMVRVSELNAPMSSLPLFGYQSDGNTTVNKELFRIKKRITGAQLDDFQRLHNGIDPNPNNAQIPVPNPNETLFRSDFRTEGRGGIKYFTASSFISDLGKSAHNFSKHQDLIGADPQGQGNIPNINAVPNIGAIGSESEYLRIRLNADGCVEFIGTSLFWNNFCIVFSEYGKRIFGIHDDFVRKELVVWPYIPGSIEYEYIMAITEVDKMGGGTQLDYEMFDQFNTVVDITGLGYHELTDTVTIRGTYPIFKNLDHRYFVSVETDLLVTDAIKVTDGKQGMDRSICKVFFPSNCKVLLESEDGILREDVDFQIETRIGQHSFVKKTEPSRQWTALQTSYDLRFYRFHLYVTYRYFDRSNKWVFTRMRYPIPSDDCWGIGLEFVSKI